GDHSGEESDRCARKAFKITQKENKYRGKKKEVPAAADWILPHRGPPFSALLLLFHLFSEITHSETQLPSSNTLPLPLLQPTALSAASALIKEKVILLVVHLQLQISFLVKHDHQNAAHILCIQDAHDLQFLLYRLRKRIELRVEIKFLLICICRA